ncbi:ABC transporter substrate-binding protein [Paenibacillus humicola]|uniref:ABC transporter substrate-binding protein n=1 Tax=Paenibacillus humicola TaxID=3110540 RepID=UPI00237C2F98|nr:extracellular solute-binding protein [Paenibacillus humicola]
MVKAKCWLGLAGSALLSLGLLAGCGGNSTSSGNSGSGGGGTAQTAAASVVAPDSTGAYPIFNAYDKDVDLTWWTWISTAPDIAKAFEKSYPHIHIHVVNVGNGTTEYSKLVTALKAGTGAPDIAFLEYQVLPQFINTGGLVDISPYIGNLKPYYLPWTWNQVSAGSKVYAVPQDIGPMVLWYDKHALDSAGIAIPKTWDEYAAAAKQYHQKTGKYFTYFPLNEGGWIMGLLWQAGVEPFSGGGNSWKIDLNTPKAKQVLEYWGGLIQSGAVKADQSFSPEWGNEIGKGEYATIVDGAWVADNFLLPYVPKGSSEAWRVAVPPQWNASGAATNGNNGGSSNAVTTQSKHPDAAALFAGWYTSSEAGLTLELNPTVPGHGPGAMAAKNVEQSYNIKDDFLGGQAPAPVYKQAASSVDTSYQWSPWTTYVYNQMTVEFTKAAGGQESWDQALDNVQKNVVAFAKSEGYDISQ